MEIVYFIIFSIFVSLPANSSPILDDYSGVSNAYGILRGPLTSTIDEESLAHTLGKREISEVGGKTNELKESSDDSKDVLNHTSDNSNNILENSFDISKDVSKHTSDNLKGALENSSDISKDVDNEQTDQNNGESLKGSETRNYRPFFRFQKVSRTRYTRPKYPLSNYANDRDRFPTTF